MNKFDRYFFVVERLPYVTNTKVPHIYFVYNCVICQVSSIRNFRSILYQRNELEARNNKKTITIYREEYTLE